MARIIIAVLLTFLFLIGKNGIGAQEKEQLLLDKKFLPLQEKDVYYKDKRCRHQYRFWEAKQVKKYKANFGKKIWVKSWQEKDFKRYKRYFGKIKRVMKFKINAIEISKKVSPHINKKISELIKKGIISERMWKKWLEKFEEWGRTYFNLGRMGHALNSFKIIDGENGNCLILNGKMYFIEEDKQKVIDILFSCPYLQRKSHREN